MKKSQQENPERDIKIHGYGNKLYIVVDGNLITELSEISIGKIRQWDTKGKDKMALQINIVANKHRYMTVLPEKVKAGLSAINL